MRWNMGTIEVDTDLDRIDFDVVNTFLAQSYWADSRPAEKNIAGWKRSQTVFGVYDAAENGRQVGGARVVGDAATFGWLADVFILPTHQSRGIGKFLMQCILEEPDCANLGRFILGTRDAHGLYEQYGWIPLSVPDRWMERVTEPNSCLQPETA